MEVYKFPFYSHNNKNNITPILGKDKIAIDKKIKRGIKCFLYSIKSP